MMKVDFFRPFRTLKNGGMVSSNYRVGITEGGALILPAEVLGVSNAEALAYAGNPIKPVVLVDGIMFIDIEHAIDHHAEPATKEDLRRLQKETLKRLRR